MLKVFCEGSKGYINQIDRIKQGFIDNGCQLTSLEEAELIYFNDPNSYDLEVKIKNSKAKVIFNVLDIPFHLIDSQRYDVSRYPVIEMPSYWKKDFNPHNLFDKLKICDAVTCICNEVQWQLKNWGNIESTVIHNPVKDVSYLNLFDHQKFVNKKGNLYKYLYVGRANDPNKRFKIIYETMKLLGDKSDTLAVIGSENPNWGDYYGVVDDINLNIFYVPNSNKNRCASVYRKT